MTRSAQERDSGQFEWLIFLQCIERFRDLPYVNLSFWHFDEFRANRHLARSWRRALRHSAFSVADLCNCAHAYCTGYPDPNQQLCETARRTPVPHFVDYCNDAV